MAQCSTCGAGLRAGATRCLKCGGMIEYLPPPAPIQPAQNKYPPPIPQVVYVQQPNQPEQYKPITCSKSKVAAGVLALFLGGIGIHKFYLGRIGQGIIYLLLSWTFLPMIIAFFEGIYYFGMDESTFCKKYGSNK